MAPNYKAKLIKFSPDEWESVCKRAAALSKRCGTYIREIAVQGVIKNYDMKQFNHLLLSFQRIGNEINQIAKDVEDLKMRFSELETVFAKYLLPIQSLKIPKGDCRGYHKIYRGPSVTNEIFAVHSE